MADHRSKAATFSGKTEIIREGIYFDVISLEYLGFNNVTQATVTFSCYLKEKSLSRKKLVLESAAECRGQLEK